MVSLRAKPAQYSGHMFDKYFFIILYSVRQKHLRVFEN
jgi:hypothetical protein